MSGQSMGMAPLGSRVLGNVYARGKPNSYGSEVIHFAVTDRRLDERWRPACFCGAYHLWYSWDQTRVTCPRCLETLKGGG